MPRPGRPLADRAATVLALEHLVVLRDCDSVVAHEIRLPLLPPAARPPHSGSIPPLGSACSLGILLRPLTTFLQVVLAAPLVAALLGTPCPDWMGSTPSCSPSNELATVLAVVALPVISRDLRRVQRRSP